MQVMVVFAVAAALAAARILSASAFASAINFSAAAFAKILNEHFRWKYPIYVEDDLEILSIY